MDISIKNLQTKVPIQSPRVNRTALQALKHLGILSAELSFVFVTPAKIKALNTQYLKHSYVTDILTFDYAASRDRRMLRGEIVIAPSVAVDNAKLFGTTLASEIDLYVIHGILHLAGYDDHGARKTARMRAKETELLGALKKAAKK